MPQNSQFWACFGVFGQLNLVRLLIRAMPERKRFFFSLKPSLTKSLFPAANVTKILPRVLIKLHTKRFSCDKCQKTFGENSKLRSHERVHSGEKPFSCQTCLMSFAHGSSLHSHTKVHNAQNGEKQHSCSKCIKSFSKRYHV